MAYKINDIDDYMNKITKEQAEELINHCNNYGIQPEIIAWYEDKDDLYDDYNYIGVNNNELDDMIERNQDMFCFFNNGEIVKLSK